MLLQKFRWKVTIDSNGSKSFRVREVKLGDGYSQVVGDGINTERDEQKIKFVGLIGEVKEVTTFLEEHAGYKPFIFEHPLNGEGVYLVDGFSYNPVAKDLYTLNFTLKQAYL